MPKRQGGRIWKVEEAQETLKHSLRPFEEVKASFVPTNMNRDEFNRILRLMEKE